MTDWHLMRIIYRTDAKDDEPDYIGSFSGTIPDRVFQSGYQMVGVDWSQRGVVEVTFLAPGPGFVDQEEA